MIDPSIWSIFIVQIKRSVDKAIKSRKLLEPKRIKYFSTFATRYISGTLGHVPQTGSMWMMVIDKAFSFTICKDT